MRIEERKIDSLDLSAHIASLVDGRHFDAALDMLQSFVERVIFDPASVARVFVSHELDSLCKSIASAKVDVLETQAPAEPAGTVILVSELSRAGGHNELIKDIIRLKLFAAPIRILQTDCFDRVNAEVSAVFSESTGAQVLELGATDAEGKFSALIRRVREASPQNLLLLGHNQDALTISTAFASKAVMPFLNVVYVHHGDHHLSLGAATNEFVHVDPHNIGYFHCKEELGHPCNHYWPLTVNIASKSSRQVAFLEAGRLITCSSGRPEKFESGSYRFDYFELIPLILRNSGGTHVHIGELTPERLDGIRQELLKTGIDPSRFVHIPWVNSVSRALVDHQVDLYISSFPLGGGKATLEAMASGIPLLMHQSYRSRFHGGVDIAYSGAFVWRTEEELLEIIRGIDADTLSAHSALALRHYERFHSDDALVASCNFDVPQDEAVIPPLRDYKEDPLQCFLDDARAATADREWREGRIEAQRAELQLYENQSQDLLDQLSRMTAKVIDLGATQVDLEGKMTALEGRLHAREVEVSNLSGEIQALRSSTSWKITKPIRFASRLMKGDATLAQAKSYLAPRKFLSLVKRRLNRVLETHGALPPDFDGATYLKLNPDLISAGVDAADHFLLHGRREGRPFALPNFEVVKSEKFRAGLQTVLLVGHEASRTGAPVLSLNLVQLLVRKYNVVVLLLGGGDLVPSFEATGATVLVSAPVRGNPFVAHFVGTRLCESFDFRFALVNSIEARYVLPVLAEHFVPTISLVHEFASYTRPKSAFRDALQWSGEVVFSANVTRENALSAFPELAEFSAHVLPQGKCVLPASMHDEEGERCEAARLRHLIRPEGMASDALVVLGAGFVQLRKGVDLFIECAAQVKRLANGRAFRFVWIGSGYDPENDVGYSVYLHDQLRRADLIDDVVFLGETEAIEAAYEVADLFLLSSRLDPLPNVAIDAMSQGVPVLCFDKTTGIADFLHDAGLSAFCVAPYLDTQDIARKIIDFSASTDLIANVGAQCRAAAAGYFDMARYIERLEALAEEVRLRVTQEQADCQVILESGIFRADFASFPADASEAQAVRRYVRAWSSGIGRRKPFPGFHPGMYLEQHGVAVPAGDPLADYLRAGKPQGPWSYPVITPADGSVTQNPTARRVALHIHAYYVDLLPEILSCLASNAQMPDLFISVTRDELHEAVRTHVQHYKGRTVRIQTVPNRGRDIGPFFTAFFPEIRASYDFVGHIHTKKSVDVKDANLGKVWFAFLIGNLIGRESCGMMDVILDRLQSDPALGMVFPDDPYITGIESNREPAESMGKKIGISAIPEYFLYPVGTMFWARPAALEAIADLDLQWDDYPEEPLPYDGTLLHAMERLVALALPGESLKLATTNLPGVTR
jgi:glycosyltransferase involved in cell wall biosynthesis